MKVQAKQREFNIYSLFLHDNDSVEVTPFDQWELAKKLNALAMDMCPEMLIEFVCPNDSGLSQWNVRFSVDRYDYDESGEIKYQTYPTPRVYDEREFRKFLPPELDEALGELNKADIVL